MGKIRKYSKRISWSTEDVELLKKLYSASPRAQLLVAFPNRSISSIETKAHSIGIYKPKKIKRSIEETLKAKREFMKRKRDSDIVSARKYSCEYYHKNRDENLLKMKEYQKKRFFWIRSTKLKSSVNAKDLARIWKNQKGLCALTGRKLTRTNAHLDHITPKSKGGGDEKYNLRWLCVQANLAKRELSDAEFVELCNDVMAWIGRRIQMVEDILKQQNDVTATIPQL